MKKSLIVILTGLLVAASLSSTAMAGKKKSTKPPAPLYLHGRGPATEAYINETWIDSNFMRMDSTEPVNPYPSSMFVTNYVKGPNTDCDGNGLIPFWRGDFTKPFKGDVTITLNTVATPAATMVVSLYSDPTGTCGSTGSNPAIPASEAPQPVATETIDVAPGPGITEITFKGLNIDPVAGLGLMLYIPQSLQSPVEPPPESPTGGSAAPPVQIRVLFDSPDFASGIFFN